MRLSSPIFGSIVSMVLFWYHAKGSETSCTGNDTSYLRVTVQTVYTIERVIEHSTKEYKPDCNFWEKIASFFTGKCETKEITVYRIGNQTVAHALTPSVKECCPGHYKNSSGICVQSDCGPGKYGTNCSDECLCADPLLYCDNTGLCICPEGFNGTNCTDECDASHYGRNCAFECACSINSVCDTTYGTCNCTTPGWHGELCNRECSNTSFGLNCAENCTCNENQTCDHIDGSCTCKPGWTGDNCSQECEQGRFGTDCNQTCTCNNETSVSCDPTNGHCLCKPGYIGIHCDYICDFGTYGQGCENNCSDRCETNLVCDYIDGSCACPGSKGDNCSEECEPGTFGLNCSKSCDCNMTNSNGTCNSTTGQCFCTDDWTGSSCAVDISKSSMRNNPMGIATNDLMIIVITSGLAMVVLIVGGAIIYRKRWMPRDKDAEEDDVTKSLENRTYGRNKEIDETEEHADKYSQESELNGDLLQNGVVTVRDKEETDKRSSSRSEEHNSTASDQVVYEDADLELDNLETKTEPPNDEDEEDNDYDKTHAPPCKSDSRFQDDEVLYESADDESEHAEKRQPNHYSTFDEVEKIGLDSVDKNKCDEVEEDYNVLEHFPHQSKKMSLKEEDYSSFDAVQSVAKQADGDAEESDYDALVQNNPVRRAEASIAHERYHHIDLKNKTIDGEKVVAVPSPDNRISKMSREEADVKKPDGVKLNVIKHESTLSDTTEEEDYTFCEIDDEDKKSDIHEDMCIYEECTPDETLEKESEVNDIPKVSELLGSDKTVEVVYESCGSSDEDEAVARTETDIVYEDVSDDISDDNKSSDDEGDKKQLDEGIRARRRRSEDYEEFEL